MRGKATWSLVLLAVVWCSTARADDVRPASLEVVEVADGRFDVRFQTPMRGRVRLRVRPNLPDAATLVKGTYERTVRGDSAIERFTFELAEGLVGKDVGVEGLALGSRGAVLQIRLRDGRDLRAVLGGARPTYHVEPAPEETRAPWTDAAAAAARAGLAHGLLEIAHLLLALGLALALGVRGVLGALALFLIGNVGGAAIGLLLPTHFVPGPGVVEAFTALAACFALRAALRGRIAGLGVLVLAAGLVHGVGSGAHGLRPLPVVAHALGLDLAHLVVGGLALVVLRLVQSPVARRTAAWGLGAVALAAAVVAAARPDPIPLAERPTGILPMTLASATAASTAPVRGLQTDLEAYLDVGVFDTRVEILARLSTFERWLGLSIPAPVVPVQAQEALLARIGEALLARIEISIDESDAQPDAIRRGFAMQDARGTWLREEPVPESAAEALVGVTYALARPTIPRKVEVRFTDLPADLASLRARIIDPETSREIVLAASDPRLLWTNELREAPIPDAEVVRVRRHPFPVPLLSLGILAVGIGFAVRVPRGRRRRRAGLTLRLTFALALLVLPLVTVDASAHVGEPAAPSKHEAWTIASALLENLYLAFNMHEEEAVYDRLAFSLTEASRTDAYVQSRRSLTFARVGGARTHVEVVELRLLEDIEATGLGGFRATATWTVAGSVTHFGHRHLRQNVYRARLAVVPVSGAWKIDAFDVEDIARER